MMPESNSKYDKSSRPSIRVVRVTRRDLDLRALVRVALAQVRAERAAEQAKKEEDGDAR